MRYLHYVVAGYLLSLVFLSCSSSEKADHIYINAKIWTGDTSNPSATAIAISGNKILYVGNDYQSYQGSQTVVTDLQGKMMVPGFIDNHTHFLIGGYQLGSVNLRDAKTHQAFIQTLHSYIITLTDKRWVEGGDWDHEAWGGDLPTKEWIDSISGEHPIFIARYDGHMSLANSIALKLAGIDKNTKSPEGGTIVKDPKTGEPTGILKDGAMKLVDKVMPPPTEKELAEYLQSAIHHAFEHGFTQVHDMGSFGGWPDLEAYRNAYANKQLDLRIYSFVPLRTWQKLDSFVKKNGWGDDQLRWGGLKGFADGSLGSTTAWFYQPYLDAPNSTGLQVTDTTLIRKWILGADSVGLHIAIHAIGDKANDYILDSYQLAENKNGKKDRRFRIEHAQHLSKDAIPRFAALGVTPSMQPYHAVDDGNWAYKRLDSDRLKRTYVFRDLLQTGANLTFGSDWTVAPLDALAGIYAAVTRRTSDGKNPNGWFPDQKITVDQALRCYTVNNAYAGFQETKLGMLKAGFYADLAVLSGNLFEIAPEKIRDIKVELTVVNGKEVYKK